MRLRHGSVTLDLPPDWRDESVLVFVAPELGAASLPTQATVRDTPPAVTVRLLSVDDGADPRDVVAERAAALRAEAARFELVAEGPITSGLGDGWCQTHELVLGDTRVRQLVAAFCLGPVGVLAVAAGTPAQLAARGGQLRAVVESLSTGEPGEA